MLRISQNKTELQNVLMLSDLLLSEVTSQISLLTTPHVLIYHSTNEVDWWSPCLMPSLFSRNTLYVTCAILAPCLSNLPSLILSTAASILVSSVAIRPSHFLFRRIWTLLTAQASAASLSDSQQTRRDKQERTEHFIRITNRTLDGRGDNTVGRHFEGKLCLWNILIWIEAIFWGIACSVWRCYMQSSWAWPFVTRSVILWNICLFYTFPIFFKYTKITIKLQKIDF